MLICDVFDLRASLLLGPPRRIRWELFTDLPAGACCTVAVERSYDNADGLLELWTLHEELVTVSAKLGYHLNGASGEIDVDQGDLEALKELLSDPDASGAGMQQLPSDDIEVSCILGGGQPLEVFGLNNTNLQGRQVTIAGDLRVIDVSTYVVAPMAEEIDPQSL